MRICSLLPGATEILAALGLADQLVGISHECDFPPEVTSLPRVTTSLVDPSTLRSAEIDDLVTRALQNGTPLYEIDEALLATLQPDLIVTQDLCLVCAVDGGQVRRVVAAGSQGAQVISLHIGSLDDLWRAITDLGEATDIQPRATRLIADLRARLELVQSAGDSVERPGVLCLEWLDPPWIAGHWMPEAVALAGGHALLASPDTPSQRVSWDDVVVAQPEIVVIMPCGFDIPRALEEVDILAGVPPFRQLPAVAADRVYVIDGSAYFNRAGPRLVDGIEILAGLFRGSPILEHAAVRLDCRERVG